MQDRKNFIRNIEDFTCGHCQVVVKGTGYTNHCPSCLWSKHVDNLPGDRASSCAGMMKPEAIELDGDSYDILHKCQRCGITKRNKVADNDDRQAIVDILSQA